VVYQTDLGAEMGKSTRRKRELYGGSIADTGGGMSTPSVTGLIASPSLGTPQGTTSEVGSADLQALQAAGQYVDPYEARALNYKQAGRRFPDPQGAQRSLYYQNKIRTQTANMPWIGSESPYGAASVAGVRQTQQGIIGKSDPRTDFYPDSRIKAEMKVNVWNDEWGAAGVGYRRAGLLSSGTMEQAVSKEFPWLSLGMSRGSNDSSAIITARAGMSEGGAVSTRTFFVGGGFTSCLYLAGYDNVSVTIDAITGTNPEVGFAWVVEGNQGGNLNLYRPFNVTVGMVGAPQSVPEGSFEVVPAATDAAWNWTATLAPGFTILGVTAGVKNPVLGNLYTPAAVNSVTWILRPI